MLGPGNGGLEAEQNPRCGLRSVGHVGMGLWWAIGRGVGSGVSTDVSWVDVCWRGCLDGRVGKGL
jgi:hypothetical protein